MVLFQVLTIMVCIIFLKIDYFSIQFFFVIGVGSDPNYGSFIQRPNMANAGGILPISYNPNSNLNNYLVNPSHQRQQQQQNYLSGYNKNNPWQRPNTNNYYI